MMVIGDAIYMFVEAHICDGAATVARPPLRPRVPRLRHVRAASVDARPVRAGYQHRARAHQGPALARFDLARSPASRDPVEAAFADRRPRRADEHLDRPHRAGDPAGVPFAARARAFRGAAHRAGDARLAHRTPQPLPGVRAAQPGARAPAGHRGRPRAAVRRRRPVQAA